MDRDSFDLPPWCGLGFFWNQSPIKFGFKNICVRVDRAWNDKWLLAFATHWLHHWNCSKQHHQWQMCRWHRQVLQNQHPVDVTMFQTWAISSYVVDSLIGACIRNICWLRGHLNSLATLRRSDWVRGCQSPLKAAWIIKLITILKPAAPPPHFHHLGADLLLLTLNTDPLNTGRSPRPPLSGSSVQQHNTRDSTVNGKMTQTLWFIHSY